MFSRFNKDKDSSMNNTNGKSSPGGILRRKWVSTPDFKSLKGKNDKHIVETDDDPMEEEDSSSDEHHNEQVVMMPIRDDPSQDTSMTSSSSGHTSSSSSSSSSGSSGGMKKVVSFSTFNNLHRIPSRHEFISEKADIWYEKRDVTNFARNELTRRQNMGITSTGMLCSSVPCYDDDDDHDDDDEDMGVSF
mmetsp:Transcript_29353/g.41071  ORF Transcript_29353/g.41071 Transcript_29353/m.41071 type:complete len:190 (+) Transcript_29353:411-980(+)